MNRGSADEPPRIVFYLLLSAIQMFGSDFVVWKALPAFRELALNPGEQLPNTPYDGYSVIPVLLLMQAAYWRRLKRVVIPFRGQRLILSHVFLLLGRSISFLEMRCSPLLPFGAFRSLVPMSTSSCRRAAEYCSSCRYLRCSALRLNWNGSAQHLGKANRVIWRPHRDVFNSQPAGPCVIARRTMAGDLIGAATKHRCW
jgi:hypothetical protein